MQPKPLDQDDLAELEALLDGLPPPLEPMDVSALDGFLVGVLLQPQPVAEAGWLRHVADVDARPAPASARLERLHGLVRRRHAELNQAIAGRQWFDPWVFELDEDASPSEAVLPWVAGFATAMALFPGLMRLPSVDTLEPLATLFAHMDPDDLEDADELLAEIETLEPPVDMTEAVDGLVRSCLQLADVSRPVQRPATKRPGPRRTPRR